MRERGRRIAGTASWSNRLIRDQGSGTERSRHDGFPDELSRQGAKNPAPHPLHRHAGARPDIPCRGVPARGSKENATHFEEICGGNALNAAIGIVRLGGRASICGPMGDARETSDRYILDKLAHEGIETKHVVHMPGLVTPISAIMIDPSGERTIVTFRDPEFWKVHLPPIETLLDDCAAILTESRCRGILHRPLRRGRPARHSRHRRRRPRDVAARGVAERVLASGVLERTAAGDRRHRRRCQGAARRSPS